jgi:hypothetical protein
MFFQGESSEVVGLILSVSREPGGQLFPFILGGCHCPGPVCSPRHVLYIALLVVAL